jgi:hypothetical protein
MSKDLTVTEILQIPANIKKLWGKPPVLPNESLDDYNALALAIANDFKPNDTIGWLSVRDIVYHKWQIPRMHLYMDKLIKIGQYDLYKDYCEKENITDENQQLKVKKYYQTTDRGTVMAFRQDLETYERMASLLAGSEVCSAALVGDFERRRDARAASRLRKASDDIIDGEFTEPQPASGQVANVVGMPVTHDLGKPAPADSSQVKKNILVKKGTTMSPAQVTELMKGIGKPASHGLKKGAA